jgi:hypothetical protein
MTTLHTTNTPRHLPHPDARLDAIKRFDHPTNVQRTNNTNYALAASQAQVDVVPRSTFSPKPAPVLNQFRSSLVDTIRAIVKVRHAPLDRVAQRSGNMRRDGFVYFVRVSNTNAKAQVISRNECKELILEFSIPKILTGQNIVGHHDLHAGCVAGIKAVLKAMAIMPTQEERSDILAGYYRLTRVDIAAHIACGTTDRAAALMIALRNHLVGFAKDVSFYETKTLYIGQHSRRRSLKIYRKEMEGTANPMSLNVYGREALIRRCTGLVRIELVLRREELTKLGLDNPRAWTPGKLEELMGVWIARLQRVGGCVPNVAHLEELSPVLQQKIRAWLHGDKTAFTRGVTRETYRDNRNRVLTATGINVDNHMTPEQQQAALLSIRQMFREGFGYCSSDHKWKQLIDAVASTEKTKPKPR